MKKQVGSLILSDHLIIKRGLLRLFPIRSIRFGMEEVLAWMYYAKKTPRIAGSFKIL